MRTFPQERIKELEEAWRRKHDGRSRKRLQVMRLVARRTLNAGQTGEVTGVNRSTVFNYVNRFPKGGVKGLPEDHCPGPNRGSVDEKNSEALRDELRQGNFRRAKDARKWFAKRAIKLALPTVYYWLGKAGKALKMPRKTHARKDAAKARAFKGTPAQKPGGVARGAAGMRVWVADEHRYGFLPVIRRCRTLKGVAGACALCDTLPIGLFA